jgi:hypothetical protein
MNPFLIGTQREGEDRITYMLCVLLEHGRAELLVELLRELGANVPDVRGPLTVEPQVNGPVSRPDARFEFPDGATVLFENKMVPNSLREDQIRGHLEVFGATRVGAMKILLAITADSSPPTWWESMVRQQAPVLFAHGSWRAVASWAKRAADAPGRDPVTRYLLTGFVEYLCEQGGITSTPAGFDPARVARVCHGAHAWIEDMQAQHSAQEAFFEEVAGEFRARFPTDDGLTLKIASRWPDWSPISTFLELTPSKLRQPGVPPMRVWAEAYLDTAAEPRTITLRSGLLLEGKSTVSTWFGLAQTIAQDVFGERFWCWHHGGAYAEVWASRSLMLTQLDATRDGMAEDLVTWATTIIDQMADARAREG